MTAYEEGLGIIDEMFANGKDNLISLATVALEPGSDGKTRPAVRTVDAYYENGVFYVTTNAKGNKMLQIARNPNVAVAAHEEMFTSDGIGENLGWVLDPKNADIRCKLREAFSEWYDTANNENDENCCILAIRLTKGILNVNHWEKLYYMDFVGKKETSN